MRRRWLVTGASGKLGGHVVRSLELLEGRLGATIVTTSRTARPDPRHRPADLRAPAQLARLLATSRPTHVVHLGGVTGLTEAAAAPAYAWRVNVEATRQLARYAQETRAWLVLASSDFVFDGQLGRPYRESDPPCPRTTYGTTKVAAERAILERGGAVARLSLLYGWPLDAALRSTFTNQLDALRGARHVRVVTDEWRTPVSLADAARVLVRLGQIDYRGLLNVGGPERMTAADFVRRCGQILGLTPILHELSRAQLACEPRPADVSLDSSRLRDLAPELQPAPLRAAALQRPRATPGAAARDEAAPRRAMPAGGPLHV